MIDGSALPSFITFDPVALTFSVESEDELIAGQYDLKIRALFPDGSYDESLTWTLVVTAEGDVIVDQTSAPYFESPLRDQLVQAGTTGTYILPRAIDPDEW